MIGTTGRCVSCGASTQVNERNRLLGPPLCADCGGVARPSRELVGRWRARRAEGGKALAFFIGAGAVLFQLLAQQYLSNAPFDPPSLSADLESDRVRSAEWPAASCPPRIVRVAIDSSSYPPAALRAGHQGTTRLKLLVGSTGTLRDCAVLDGSGSAELDRAACEGLRHSTYQAAADASGEPVEATLSTAVRWEIPE